MLLNKKLKIKQILWPLLSLRSNSVSYSWRLQLVLIAFRLFLVSSSNYKEIGLPWLGICSCDSCELLNTLVYTNGLLLYFGDVVSAELLNLLQIHFGLFFERLEAAFNANRLKVFISSKPIAASSDQNGVLMNH